MTNIYDAIKEKENQIAIFQAQISGLNAEIEALRLSRIEPVSPLALRYLNRLSDLLFVLARWIAKQSGEAEYLWERGLRLPAKRAKGK